MGNHIRVEDVNLLHIDLLVLIRTTTVNDFPSEVIKDPKLTS
jgi:hypothetical protein